MLGKQLTNSITLACFYLLLLNLLKNKEFRERKVKTKEKTENK